MPMDTAVEDLPEVNLNAELDSNLVQHGMPVQVTGAPTEGTVRMTSGEEKLFVGVACGSRTMAELHRNVWLFSEMKSHKRNAETELGIGV